MTVAEKIQEAFRLAGEAFDEVFIEKYGGELDFSAYLTKQWPETKLRAIGPMAAEIYRQSNRMLIVSVDDKHRDEMVKAIKRAGKQMTPTVFLHDPEIEITTSDVSDGAILDRMRQTVNDDIEAEIINRTVTNASSTAYRKRKPDPSKLGDSVPVRAFRNTAKVSIELEIVDSNDYLTVPAQHWVTTSGDIYTDVEFNELYEAVSE